MFLNKKPKGGSNMNQREVGNRLKEIIKVRGIKRKDLADKLGMSNITLTRKLNAQAEFNIREVLMLKQILDLDAELCGNIFFSQDFNVQEYMEEYAKKIVNKKA